jgi:hypothetical protein
MQALSNSVIFLNLGRRTIESRALEIPDDGRKRAENTATANSLGVSAGKGLTVAQWAR